MKLRLDRLGACLSIALVVSPLAGTLVPVPGPAGLELVVGLPASAVGAWEGPLQWPLEAIHATVLPTGEVLVWQNAASARRWDPRTGDLTAARLDGRNVFCSGHTLLPDGRLLVVGGLGGLGGSNAGHRATQVYDPWSRTWSRGPDLEAGRWYPGVVSLADGRVLTMGGNDEDADANRRVEVFAAGAWTRIPGADRQVPTYPRLHLLPSGEVVRAGPDARADVFDPATGHWRNGPVSPQGFRGGGGSVLLPGLDRILTFGGANQGQAKQTAEILELQGEPRWRETGSMMVARRDVNPVLLPDGSVLAVGGTPTTGKSPAMVAPERFDPATETWSLLAPAQRGRTYHSIALLLPDARVLVAGSDVEIAATDSVQELGVSVPREAAGLLVSRTAEVFSPPYLFLGPRPVIAQAPSSMSYGASFEVRSPDAGGVGQVVLMRLGTTTHSVNFDQRHVALAFTTEGDALRATAPATGGEAPPGWYMLFLLSTAGVPSEAAMVRLG